MTFVFADTFYFLALLNAKDAAHARAAAFSESYDTALLTTAWVLTELADALANSRHRANFQRVLDQLQADPDSVIVPPSPQLFDEGIRRYTARTDKDWSLTDCISFVVMEQHDVNDALTGDHHFQQAGFRALLA
jgi:uncharacterized protein